MPADSREYDVVVFGATGFTGRLVARYLAAQAPPGLRWALAGRDRRKLEAVREGLVPAHASGQGVGLVTADSADPQGMRRLARSARVVASTAGPFVEYGGALVAACAEQGTDYADISGEPEFVDRMWLQHHQRAVETGARLVHSCGFDSIPPDIGAWWTVRQLPAGEPISMRAYVSAAARVSAGTYSSAIHALGRVPQVRSTAAQRKAAEVPPSGRRIASMRVRAHRDPVSCRWAVPLPTIDALVVRRSASACEEYGSDFRYGHYADVGSAPAAAATMAGAAGVMALARIPPARAALLWLATAAEGPSVERRAKSWFRVRFVATAGPQTVVTSVSGGDPGYDETAKMLAESALSLARDDLPDRAGQLTPVQAMGPALLARLRRAGIRFDVHDTVPS